jgi:hypothetical protein
MYRNNNNRVMRNLIIAIILFLGLDSVVCSQNINNDQYYKDYDSLISIIKNVDPRLEFWKKIAGVDILQKLNHQRQYIDTIKNINEFTIFINATMAVCLDGHSSVVPPEIIEYTINELPVKEKGLFLENFDTTDIQKLKVQFSKYLIFQDSLQVLIKERDFRIQCRYLDGRYFLTNTFITNKEEFQKGWEIIKLDQISLPDSLSVLLGTGSSMPKWDNRNKRFYSNKFIPGQLKSKKTVQIAFSDHKGSNHALQVCPDQKSKLKNTKYVSLYDQSTIKYFKEYKMLYIRMAEMSLKDGFIKKIIEETKTNEIISAVINTSGNYGGDDSAWKKVLSVLLKDTLCFNYSLGYKENETIKKQLGPGVEKLESKYFPFTGERFITTKIRDTIIPLGSSLKKPLKIFIIHDEDVYSSASALLALANQTDKITSIGFPTGWMGGFGSTPLYFKLPETGIIIRIEPAIDLTSLTKLEDVFPNDDIRIEQTLNWYYQKNIAYDRNSLKTLKEFPPFQEILKIISE